MEIKHLIAAVLLVLLSGSAVAAASLSQRVRDWMFAALVAGAVLADRVDVNFLSHAWYRGSTQGIEITLLDVLAVGVLVASLLVPRYRGPRWFWPAGLGMMLAYLVYGVFSVAISEPRIYGLFELSKIARGIVVFFAAAVFVRTRRELRWLVTGLVAAVLFEGLVAGKQRFFGGTDRVMGSLGHANSLSMYLCLVGPVLAAAAAADFPRWLRRLALGALGVAACTMMLTLSRAGIPIFGLMLLGTAAWCVSWRINFRRLLAGSAIAAVAVGVLLASWRPLLARYGEATLADEYLVADAGYEGRGVYLRWAREISGDHFFGLGLNNWSYGVSKTYGAHAGFVYGDYDRIHSLAERLAADDLNFAAPAHNLGALTLGELGIPGLVIFALMWLRWFHVGAEFLRRRWADPMYRLGTGIFFGLGGIFLQSQTEWVFRQTPIFLTAHALLGTLAALHFHRRSSAEALATRAAAVRVVRPAEALAATVTP